MTNAATELIITSLRDFGQRKPGMIQAIFVSEDEVRPVVQVDLHCRYTEKGLPVFFTINEAAKMVTISTEFFFTIQHLTLFDEYELVKAFNNGIDFFKISMDYLDNKTRVRLKYDFPCMPENELLGSVTIQLVEMVIPAIDRFLTIYSYYWKQNEARNAEKEHQNIVVLAQYRKHLN